MSFRWQARYSLVLACVGAQFIAYIDRVNISVAAIAMQESLGWTEVQKGIVLSSFFVGYLSTQVLGGWMANRIGGRLTLGVALVWWSVFTILTPLAAIYSFGLLIAVRIALGLGEGPLSPAALNLFGKWVPADERSRAVALYSSAAILGTLAALVLTGLLVASYGWHSVFYGFGVVGIIYAIYWFNCVYETPADHPNVSESEQAILAENKPAEGLSDQIPWRKIFSLPCMYALLITYFCTSWSLYVFLSWMPSYFATVHGLKIVGAGAYAMIPWVAMFVMINVAGWIADGMIRRGISITFVRKLMQTIGLVGSAAFLLVTRQVATPEMALVTLASALGLLAFAYSGSAPNVIDIAPRFGGVIFGVMNTLGTLPGIIGVALTGWLVQTTGSYDSVLLLAAVISFVGAAVYLALGTAEKLIE